MWAHEGHCPYRCASRARESGLPPGVVSFICCAQAHGFDLFVVLSVAASLHYYCKKHDVSFHNTAFASLREFERSIRKASFKKSMHACLHTQPP